MTLVTVDASEEVGVKGLLIEDDGRVQILVEERSTVTVLHAFATKLNWMCRHVDWGVLLGQRSCSLLNSKLLLRKSCQPFVVVLWVFLNGNDRGIDVKQRSNPCLVGGVTLLLCSSGWCLVGIDCYWSHSSTSNCWIIGRVLFIFTRRGVFNFLQLLRNLSCWGFYRALKVNILLATIPLIFVRLSDLPGRVTLFNQMRRLLVECDVTLIQSLKGLIRQLKRTGKELLVRHIRSWNEVGPISWGYSLSRWWVWRFLLRQSLEHSDVFCLRWCLSWQLRRTLGWSLPWRAFCACRWFLILIGLHLNGSIGCNSWGIKLNCARLHWFEPVHTRWLPSPDSSIRQEITLVVLFKNYLANWALACIEHHLDLFWLLTRVHDSFLAAAFAADCRAGFFLLF